MKKAGKSIFFAFFLLLPAQPYRGLYAQDLDLLISSLMNFHELRVIGLREVQNRPLEVHSRVVYDDVFRKRVNGIAALAWSNVAWEVDTFIPWSRASASYAMQVSYHGNDFWFQNQRDRTALYVDSQSAAGGGAFQLARAKAGRLVGGGLAFRSSSHETPVMIRDFPESDNNSMNTFFLDWIEPTFGRQLDIDGHAESYIPMLFASAQVFQRKRLTLSLSRSLLSTNPEMLYVNTSNKPELAGDRKISAAFEAIQDLIDIGLEDELSGTRISLTLFDTRMGLKIDNNPPPADPILLDYEYLGNAQGGRSGFALRYSMESDHYSLGLGLGRSYYSGEFSLNTPVLGYYENFFPIAHAADGKVAGSSFTQSVEAGAAGAIGSTESSLRLCYMHSFFDLRLDGDASLEFNLISTPIDHPLKYHVHVLSLGGELIRSFGPVTGSYSFNQLIPFAVRVDDSPIWFSEEVAGVSTRSRGGGIHQVTLYYQW
ncbi:hypothetical protein ACFL4K_01720 [Candidatus Neomarinimicrobiota bacterium]